VALHVRHRRYPNVTATGGYPESVPLRVLHLSTYSRGGGAARAASAVDRALTSVGVESRLVSAHGPRFVAAKNADRLLWHLQRSPLESWRSPARFGSLSAREINRSSADIINLHWVTDGFLSIEQIGKIDKPVVMSLYDMWAFCGTEHYGVDSPTARWRTGYTSANRPAMDTGWDIDRDAWQRKRDAWPGFHIVPASTWLTEAARHSALFESWPLTRIPHPVDPVTFQPLDKQQARAALGLDPKRPTIAFLASAGITDTRKGFDLLADALTRLPNQSDIPQILLVGPTPGPSALPGQVDVRAIGNAPDDASLVRAYCAADVLAVPSREDNMPLTAMEAQMCGRPVVAFDIGGLPDIVQHESTGYLAGPFDTRDFARGLERALDDARTAGNWGQRARERAERTWGFTPVAQQYLDVYQQVLGR